MMTIVHLVVGAVMVVATASPSAATPQQAAPVVAADANTRWAPWFGCWQVSEESVQDAAALLQELTATASGPAHARPAALVCVTPQGDRGATMTTIVNDKPVIVETIVADGARRPLADPGCTGWQNAEWSPLGARLYASAEIACGDQPKRTVSGMALMTAGPMWLDIQMIESDGRKSLRVRRYRRSANQTHAATLTTNLEQAATMPLGSKLSLADIKEASARVAPETLQAAVMELGAGGYALNKERLLELDAAGVPDSVTDLLVAISFPKRFVVERASGGGGGFGTFGGFWGGGAYDSMGYDTMWPYYSHPYFYSSYYSPFGYRYWGYFDRFYFNGPGFVVVNPGYNSGGTPGEIAASGTGRVVDGLGYTRIRRNVPDSPTRVGDGSGSSGTSSSNGGSTSAGTSGVSSGGYSSGGSSGGGRTAQPRPPGM